MQTSRKSRARTIATLIGALALLWVATCGFLYSVMLRPPEAFARVMMRVPGPVAFLMFPFETLWMHARSGTLEVGDRAPDFTLTTLDKSARVQLSALTSLHQPVVLVFGSYT